MGDKIIELEDGNFEQEVVNSDIPVVVDFWAPWCGPCKAMTPIIEELADSFEGRVKIAKCNVDDNPVSPGKFEVKAIPTLIFFKGGKVTEQITGMVTKSKIETAINNML